MKHAFRLRASSALAWTALGAALIALTSQANATTVTFASLGALSPLPPGETLYTDFSSGLPSGATSAGAPGGLFGPNYGVECPSYCVAAPDTSSGLMTGQFFAVTPGQTETFTFGSAVKDVSVYIGSLDDENSITLNLSDGPPVSYTGAQLALISGEEFVPFNSDPGWRRHDRWLADERPLDVHRSFERHHQHNRVEWYGDFHQLVRDRADRDVSSRALDLGDDAAWLRRPRLRRLSPDEEADWNRLTGGCKDFSKDRLARRSFLRLSCGARRVPAAAVAERVQASLARERIRR